MRCSHGYTNFLRHTDSITWVSNVSWDMMLSEIIHDVIIRACPRTTICNKCEQSNTRGEILNSGDNVDDEESFWFSESFFKIAHTSIDEYTKILLLNLQQENMIPQRNIELNDKLPDEKYQKKY